MTGGALGEAVEEIRQTVEEAGGEASHLLLQGEVETLEETSGALHLNHGAALLTVFLVLVAQLESLLGAGVGLLTVPFALAAAVLALVRSGTSLNIDRRIGLAVLIGLMAKNGILIVEFGDQLRNEGRSVREAMDGRPVWASGRSRRP